MPKMGGKTKAENTKAKQAATMITLCTYHITFMKNSEIMKSTYFSHDFYNVHHLIAYFYFKNPSLKAKL